MTAAVCSLNPSARISVVGTAYLVRGEGGGNICIGNAYQRQDGCVEIPTGTIEDLEGPIVLIFRNKQKPQVASVSGVMPVEGREAMIAVGMITTNEFAGTIQLFGKHHLSCDLIYDPVAEHSPPRFNESGRH